MEGCKLSRMRSNGKQWLRWMGFLPLSFFLAHFSYHSSQGNPEHILWLCNTSNLVMATGLFFNLPVLVRIAVLWLIPGVPLWLIDMLATGENPVSTFLSHLGGMTVGLIALSQIKAERMMWLYAWIYGITLQMICRFFTPPELNINVAFDMFSGWHGLFQVYWKYWTFIALISFTGLWLLSLILNRIFPGSQKESYGKFRAETA